MNEKVLKTLEYNKIINMLKDEAGSDLGRMLCSELKPSNDLNEIKKNQLETDDALKRIWQKGSVSFSGIKDIGESLKRLEIGSTLGVGELLSISSLLKVALRVKTFSRNEDAERDSLDDLFESIEPLTNLNKEIEKCIISEDEIADDASFNLKNIRRQVKITNDRIHSQLSSLVNSQNGKTYLQESLITMRDGRYCVPVKQEYRGNVTGIIHDQSSSGSTLFVEPTAVVELNNKLRELSVKEAEEIQIILANLSISCAEYIDQLRCDLKLLPYLDFVFAKANLAKKMKASMPEFNSNRFINIKQGRHPLLDGKKVVPIDVNLGKDFTLLIITGPNTGGKTVSLKTVGLLSLMGQAGLHIPALPGSQLGVFNEIFADIGDEQSIEQSLSTFSAHMVNTVNILEKADSDSLVLFDELGAGTDPVEGAALDAYTDEQLVDFVADKSVYARVTPEHKIRIVRAWQKRGNIVAMTGDGVNDAPALKQADVGVAMGITGTEVAKDAAAMVLTDDNFATIVKAVKNGRNIYENIKKAILFLLSGNLAGIIAVLFCSLAGLPVPFAPIHLLFINLLTDSLPAIALGLEPHSDDVMKRKPRPANESILTKDFLVKVGYSGVIISIATIGAFLLGYFYQGAHNAGAAMTMAFTTLCMSRLFHGFSCKAEKPVIFSKRLWNNPFAILAFLAGMVLINAVLWIPGLHELFQIENGMSGVLLGAIYGFSFGSMVLIQIVKAIAAAVRKK